MYGRTHNHHQGALSSHMCVPATTTRGRCSPLTTPRGRSPPVSPPHPQGALSPRVLPPPEGAVPSLCSAPRGPTHPHGLGFGLRLSQQLQPEGEGQIRGRGQRGRGFGWAWPIVGVVSRSGRGVP